MGVAAAVGYKTNDSFAGFVDAHNPLRRFLGSPEQSFTAEEIADAVEAEMYRVEGLRAGSFGDVNSCFVINALKYPKLETAIENLFGATMYARKVLIVELSQLKEKTIDGKTTVFERYHDRLKNSRNSAGNRNILIFVVTGTGTVLGTHLNAGGNMLIDGEEKHLDMKMKTEKKL